jgi:hypothetical protein
MTKKEERSYRHGFEDALELSLAAIGGAQTKEAAQKNIEGYLSYVKEDKIQRLKETLFVFKEVK